jgi:hypothetical protein
MRAVTDRINVNTQYRLVTLHYIANYITQQDAEVKAIRVLGGLKSQVENSYDSENNSRMHFGFSPYPGNNSAIVTVPVVT